MFVSNTSEKSNNIRFYSKHAGDLYIRAVCQGIFLSEIYGIEDVSKYDGATSDKTSQYVIYGNQSYRTPGTMTYNNEAYVFSGGNDIWLVILEDAGLLTNCEIEVVVKPTGGFNNDSIGIGFEKEPYQFNTTICDFNSNLRIMQFPWVESYWHDYSNCSTVDENGWHTVKMIKQGNTVTIPKNNVSFTINGTSHYIGVSMGVGTNYLKSIKIKEL